MSYQTKSEEGNYGRRQGKRRNKNRNRGGQLSDKHQVELGKNNFVTWMPKFQYSEKSTHYLFCLAYSGTIYRDGHEGLLSFLKLLSYCRYPKAMVISLERL